MCLGIKINEANPFTHSCKCSAQIDGRRRFADATFLIDGGNCSHTAGNSLFLASVQRPICQLTMDHVWDYRQRRKNDARRIMVRGGFAAHLVLSFELLTLKAALSAAGTSGI